MDEVEAYRRIRRALDDLEHPGWGELADAVYRNMMGERELKPRSSRAKKICDELGCDNKHHARGLCHSHYQQWRKKR